MNAIQSLLPLYTVAGFAVGMLVGLTGVGGGSLMTPILIVLFGVHPATAVGTDLLYAAATKTAGSLVHGYNRTVDWRVVRRLATGSVPLTVLTIWALSYVNINGAAARELITGVLTLALFATALTLVFRDRLVARYAARVGALAGAADRGADHHRRRRARRAGVDLVGRRRRHRRHRPDPALSAPADGAHRRLRHRPRGAADACRRHRPLVARLDQSADLLIPLLLGSVPGILIGSYTAVRVPEKALRLCAGGDADHGGDQDVVRRAFVRISAVRDGDDKPRALMGRIVCLTDWNKSVD